MSVEFPRIISLLRKEAGLTQKKASKDLGISQALLSHYEKGVRECGLKFLIKCADYYKVSCDYLLGVSPLRSGAMLEEKDIPEPESIGKENIFTGSLLPTLNKKLIANSLNIVYDYLAESKSKELIQDTSAYLMLSIYQVFRDIHSANDKNFDALFQIPEKVYKNYARATMTILEGKIPEVAKKENLASIKTATGDPIFSISTEILNSKYPLFSTSLLNLVKTAETEIEKVSGQYLK